MGDVVDRHVSTRACEGERHCPAYAAISAGDEDALAVESDVHDLLLATDVSATTCEARVRGSASRTRPWWRARAWLSSLESALSRVVTDGMIYWLLALFACSALFFAMLAVSWLGDRMAYRRPLPPGTAEAGGVVVTAIFGLLALLVAFTFSTAFSRFDLRRGLMAEEATAIDTAWLRLDALPKEAQPALRESFRRYTACRARFFKSLRHPDRALAELARSEELQREIWKQAVAATGDPGTRLLVLPALNAMFDITTKRTVWIRAHTPLLVFGALFVSALACAGLASYAAGTGRHLGRPYAIAFAAITSFTFYVIFDFELPSFGLIRLEYNSSILIELLRKMQ
jgi:hypothetical protein